MKARIDALDLKVDAGVQIRMYADITELLRRLGLWFLSNVPANADLSEIVARHRDGVNSLRGTFSSLVSEFEASGTEARIAELQEAGAPLDVAEDIAVLPLMGAAPEIIALAHARELSIDFVAGAYFAVGAAVGLDRLRGLAGRIGAGEHWDRLRSGALSMTFSQASARWPPKRFRKTLAMARKAGPMVQTQCANGRKRAPMKLLAPKAFERTGTHGELSIAKLTLANSQIRELASS